jgi:hypothetical protein
MSMTGTVEGGSVDLESEYGGGWRWRSHVTSLSGLVLLRPE